MKPNLITTLTAGLVASTAATATTLPAATQPPQRPNVVIFLTDDQSWADTSVFGSPDMPTPNMKRLAQNGMTFNRAYVASPSCAPSRAALLTGLWPARNGAMFNHQYPERAAKKWPDYFKELGYEVVAIGKVAHYAQVQRYDFDHSSHFTYHQDICIDEAIKWLSARKSAKPLCFMVGTNWPHVPWPKEGILDPAKVHLPPMLVDTPETRNAWSRYAAAIANADRDLGKVYDATRKILGEDTFFLFTADHGAQFPFHKWNCYNGGLRTPLIVSWPGHVAKNTRTDALVSWIDILPTALEVTGATPPPVAVKKGAIDGRSFLPVLRGETTAHRDTIHATHSGDGRMNEYPIRAAIEGRYKYIRNLAPGAEFHSHVDMAENSNAYWPSWPQKAKTDAKASATVARYFHRPAEELYDIEADPYDLNNLVNDPASAAILASLRVKVDAWMESIGDKGLPTEREFKQAKFQADQQQNAKKQNTKKQDGRKQDGKKKNAKKKNAKKQNDN
jgi:uncharacterized sulfatase